MTSQGSLPLFDNGVELTAAEAGLVSTEMHCQLQNAGEIKENAISFASVDFHGCQLLNFFYALGFDYD